MQTSHMLCTECILELSVLEVEYHSLQECSPPVFMIVAKACVTGR